MLVYVCRFGNICINKANNADVSSDRYKEITILQLRSRCFDRCLWR